MGTPVVPTLANARYPAMAVRMLSASLLRDDVVDGLYDVVARCHAEENPEEPCRSRAEVAAFIRHAPESDLRD